MEKKIKLGIKELDEMIGGGLYESSSMLLKGSPGTGKTTLGMQFIYNGIQKYDEAGLIVTFEEFPEKLYRDALSFGWDFRKLEKQNKLRVVFTSPEIFINDLKSGGLITRLVSEINLKSVLIDTVTYFQQDENDAMGLRRTFNKVLHSLERDRITSVLTMEDSGLTGSSCVLACGLSYVVDNVILLRFVEVDGEMKKAIVILKTRGSKHEEKIREYDINSHGIEIKEKFNKLEGIMSGNTRKIISDRIEQYLMRK